MPLTNRSPYDNENESFESRNFLRHFSLSLVTCQWVFAVLVNYLLPPLPLALVLLDLLLLVALFFDLLFPSQFTPNSDVPSLDHLIRSVFYLPSSFLAFLSLSPILVPMHILFPLALHPRQIS